ncbi:MAG TPA: cold shock domain-containing protein [Methylophilaceae bacterium]|nr:cold shock domain-containing protein [Methylophilaceae bacterium]
MNGKLTKWNDERGFGFITPTQGGQEIFVHISVFPKDGQRPHIGESLSFEIEIDNDGKKRAKSVSRPLRANASYRDQPVPTRHHEKHGLRGLIVPLFILGAVGVYGYGSHMHKFSEPAADYSTESAEPPDATDLHPPQNSQLIIAVMVVPIARK